jgi:hypothetical protein
MQLHYYGNPAAREVARMCGTPIYVWENGKVVAKDPEQRAAIVAVTKERPQARDDVLQTRACRLTGFECMSRLNCPILPRLISDTRALVEREWPDANSSRGPDSSPS